MFWQRTHRRRIEELIRSARTEYQVSQEYVGRVTAAIEEADVPSRTRSHRRLVAVAAGVLVVLIGLGFVPFPMGSAKGALDRALATTENATTVHVRSWIAAPESGRTGWGEAAVEGDRIAMDEWVSESEEGFYRRERRSKSGYSLTLAVGAWELTYGEEETQPTHAVEMYDPCYLHAADVLDRAQFQRKFETLYYLADWRGKPRPEVEFAEHREASLWGGYVDVVEARMTADRDWPFVFSGPYAVGDTVLVVAEIDAASDRLLSVREYRLQGNRRQQTYEATYEWDVEIPDELRSVDLPAGTKVDRLSWWETRAEQAVAQEDTRDWTVTLHSVDVNRNGDVLLSLSRVMTADSQMPSVYNSALPLVVEARGTGGERYTQDNGYGCFNARHSGYWTTTLKPANAESRPRSVTLTIWPYKESPSEDQSVTFRNIPVPPREDVDDVMAASTEVIQY